MPSIPEPGVIALRSAHRGPSTAEHSPTVLVVAEAADVRNAVARELARDFELLNASTFDSAVRKLSAQPSLAAIIIDLELQGERGAPWFLARLVDHAYEGPRILLSRALAREDASSMRRGSLSHFTLARPWSSGELRSSICTALGHYGLALRPQDM
jgi:DNA-binding NtrC family response regulator